MSLRYNRHSSWLKLKFRNCIRFANLQGRPYIVIWRHTTWTSPTFFTSQHNPRWLHLLFLEDREGVKMVTFVRPLASIIQSLWPSLAVTDIRWKVWITGLQKLWDLGLKTDTCARLHETAFLQLLSVHHVWAAWQCLFSLCFTYQ